jgi:predicted small metal-binding protein
MAKMVRCREVGVDCDFEERGATEQEVLDQCAEHGRTAHGMAGTYPRARESARRDPRGTRRTSRRCLSRNEREINRN